MNAIFGFLIALLIGSCSIWIIGKFSPDSPSFKFSIIGAFIIELLAFILSAIPFPVIILQAFIFLTIWIVMIKIVRLDAAHAFFGAVFYTVIKVVIVLFFIMRMLSAPPTLF